MSAARPRLSNPFATVALLAVTTIAPARLLAQAAVPDPAMPDASASANAVENSKFQADGVVNANAVYVRSGPSENAYPVMKLDKGATVKAVGLRFEWLKIQPPDGSFCYVAKAYVNRHGDGSQGKVTNTLYVRVGSQLNVMKTQIAMKLEPGSDVTIIGEQDEYYKIKPPEGTFLYVNHQFVDPVKVAQSDGTPVPSATEGQTTAPAQAQAPESNNPTAEGPTTAPGVSTAILENATNSANPPSTGPSTNPSTASAEEQFDKLETQYAAMIAKPLDQQEIPELQSSYEKLAANASGLPESLRRIAEAKASFLKTRDKDRQEYAAFKKRQDEMAQRNQAMQAEREEITQRLRATDIKYFTAVGVLRPSSLQQGTGGTLYRLTDPANGRTVVYIRTDESKITGLLGQFIGVKGDVANDQQLGLRVIAPTNFEQVDQGKLFTNVASQIVPPSLMPGGGATVTTGND